MAFRPFNLDARRSHRVDEFVTAYEKVDGSGVTAVVIDGGAVLGAHTEFLRVDGDASTSRVTVASTQAADRHATHVAGTMAARGKREQALGMAPGLLLISEDWENDLAKLRTLAPRIRISNHSYGPVAGWNEDDLGRWFWFGRSGDEDAKFGKYSQDERALDQLIADAPHLLSFIAAGNDRNDEPSLQPIQHYDLAVKNGKLIWKLSTDSHTHRADGWDRGGLDTLAGLGLAKNAVCVGSIDDVESGSPLRSQSYSGWGPADDGRIKPDLVANGQQLLSLSSASTTSYTQSSGTSMASPTAAGIAAFLAQHFTTQRGRAPTAAELKAVLIHTARDDDKNDGPDVVFGWGAINALAAGHTIARADVHAIELLTITPTQPAVLTMAATGDPIRATVVWTDPPGRANTGGIDDATPVLVNDIDLVLLGPGDGQPFHPYRLSRAAPDAAPLRDAPNRVDNVEVVDASFAPGTWTIRVSAHALGSGTQQQVALVTSGLRRAGATP